MIDLPKIDDVIYIPSYLYVYRGKDDICGGLATISKVEINDNLPGDHSNKIMVKFKEIGDNRSFNYKSLLEKQDELKSMFGDNYCYLNPDNREEFNCPDDDWK